MAHETSRRCTFSTDRLVVGDWHDLSDRYELDLIETVSRVLTRTTTTALPPSWRGDFDEERARQWVAARDAESPTVLVIEPETGHAVGLLILFEVAGQDDAGRVDVRLGYVVAESAWGRGLASELVGGLVDWARSEPTIGSISGGVAQGNEASARVLRKNGFKPSDTHDGEQIYELPLG